ncbi:hypothetical protein [Nonomuraea recticatena]
MSKHEDPPSGCVMLTGCLLLTVIGATVFGGLISVVWYITHW